MADATAEGLVALGRRVVAAGLVVASGGNLAARLPEPDRILVTPRGWALDELDAGALATVGLDGRHIFGPYAPTTELRCIGPRSVPGPMPLSAFTCTRRWRPCSTP